MQIKLDNIGIVKDSAIQLNGLTVITGKNNSGKTTVGKSLYAILDAVENIQIKARRDKRIYIRQQINKVEDILGPYIYAFSYSDEDSDAVLGNYPTIKSILARNYDSDIIDFLEYEKLAHDLYNEIFAFQIPESLKNSKSGSKYLRFVKMFEGEDEDNPHGKINEEQIILHYDIRKQQAIDVLNKLFFELKKDPELIEYTRENINQTLKMEFSGQIQPARESECLSSVRLEDSNTKYIQFNIQNNNIIKDDDYIFFDSPFKRVYFIDDPFVLDGRFTSRERGEFRKFGEETLIPRNQIVSHSRKLERVLHSRNHRTVFEENILSDELRNVKRQIDKVLPGTFDFSTREDFYIDNGIKLKVSNLATGTKMFSIIKILLENGVLEENTMLILDEPEAHLHPMWQNTFAEIIILLIKELGVNVLLTTHSPNFMLALDAYMRKYKICDKSNFYQTKELNNNFVHYECVNDDLGKIYQDFLTYLSDMKLLRNKYLYNEETE